MLKIPHPLEFIKMQRFGVFEAGTDLFLFSEKSYLPWLGTCLDVATSHDPKQRCFNHNLYISGRWSKLNSSSLPPSKNQKYDKLFPFFIGSQIEARINLHRFVLVFPVEFFVAVSCWGGCRKRRKSSWTRWSRKKPRKQSHRTGCSKMWCFLCWKYGISHHWLVGFLVYILIWFDNAIWCIYL